MNQRDLDVAKSFLGSESIGSSSTYFSPNLRFSSNTYDWLPKSEYIYNVQSLGGDMNEPKSHQNERDLEDMKVWLRKA